jgi:hypothetical protein
MKMNVSKVMTKRVSWVGPDSTLPEIARRMRAEDIGSIPVAHNDRLIGMVTDRDIVLRAVAEGGEIERRTARDVMTGSVLYCFETSRSRPYSRTWAKAGAPAAGGQPREAARRRRLARRPQHGCRGESGRCAEIDLGAVPHSGVRAPRARPPLDPTHSRH